MTVLFDRPPQQLTRAETGTYGRALARMANEGGTVVPARTEPTFDEIHTGDPDSGANWLARVDALAKNLRARMAMEIAENLGISRDRTRSPEEVVDALERRAGRRAGAPVDMPSRM
jgi:hypothetical protein